MFAVIKSKPKEKFYQRKEYRQLLAKIGITKISG